MALTGFDRGSLGTLGNSTGGSMITLIPTANFTPNSLGIICAAYDNGGTLGADGGCTVTDDAGNIWTSRQVGLYDPGAANAGVVIRIFTAPIGFLNTTNSVTVAFTTSIQAKGANLIEITAATGKVPTYVSSAVNVGASSATPTVTTASITIGNLVIGCGGSEGFGFTGDSDTLNGSWSTAVLAFGNSGIVTTSMSLISQYKVVTATAAQVYNPTLGAAQGVILGWAQITESNIVITSRRLGLLGVG